MDFVLEIVLEKFLNSQFYRAAELHVWMRYLFCYKKELQFR